VARQATLENRHIADTHEIFSAETAGDQHEHVTAGGVPTRQACPAYCTASRPTPSSAQAQAAALAWLLGGSLSRLWLGQRTGSTVCGRTACGG